ncbi:hypothetical protein MNBD_GAMMA17-127 [hydrothermal vent metagenome]|uniref:AAA+ ATPase domain-containing protein n=1 Tax=hydrothermal vent metagenome TaxID=652676 RepID=A0A3B0ZGN0_9ZZZZ
MYTSFYELDKPPFNLAPDPSFAHDCISHKNGLAYLRNAFDEHQGVAAIVGPPGAGKSLLSQSFLSKLRQNQVTTVTINSSNLPVDELLKMIASQLDIYPPETSQKKVLEALEKYFCDQHHLDNRVVLCIDEAQNLPRASLEAAINLASHQYNNKRFVLVIFSGQEELKQNFKGLYYKLEPLGEVEIKGYIEHRLLHAGWKGDMPISDNALNLIYRYSQGIPRSINILCGKLFLAAYLDDTHNINSKTVDSVVSEIRQEPVNACLSAYDRKDQADVLSSSSELTCESTIETKNDSQKTAHQFQTEPAMLADVELLEQCEMLLTIGAKVHESRHIKNSEAKASNLINELSSKIDEFKRSSSQQNQLDLEFSARCLYHQLITDTIKTGHANEKNGMDEYHPIFTPEKEKHRSGAARLVSVKNICKIIDLADQNMKCIKLGILGYSENIEAIFKDISGFDLSFDTNREADLSVLMWRISVSKDTVFYVIGLSINDFINNDGYAQLMNRLTAATITTSLVAELTTEEKASLLTSLLLYGSEWSQLIGPYADHATEKPYFFFQDDTTTSNISSGSNDMKNFTSTVLFQNDVAVGAA